MKFSLEGIRDQKLTKIQKFRDGLNLELQLDTQGYDGTTLGDLINKAKETEAVRNKMKVQDDAQKGGAGKRSFAVFEGKKFDAGPSKRLMFEKGQGEKNKPKGNGGVKCGVCQGPHTPQECKWKPGACYTCGQVGHTVAQCKNPVLKNAFCYHCTQRGHLYSEYP